MKKMCIFLTGLLLAMSLFAAGAVAADLSLLQKPEDSDEYRYVSQIVTAGDAAYFLVRMEDNEACIYVWREDQQEAELWAEGLLHVAHFDELENVQSWLINTERDEALAHSGVSYLFSDGQQLMGLNHLTGKIFALDAENGVLKTRELTTIKDTSFFYHVEDDYSYVISPSKVVAAGGKLLWHYSDWDSKTGENIYRIINIDLADGSVSAASVEHPMAISAYRDGRVLVLCRDAENAYDSDRKEYRPYEVCAYDPAADKAEKLGELQTDRWLYDLDYSGKLDALVWQDNTRIMGLKGLKEEAQLSYVPISGGNMLTVLGDSVMIGGSSDEGVYVRTLSEAYSTDAYLNVLNGYMDDAARAFAKANPQVPVYSVDGNTSDAENLHLLMSAGKDAPDVLTMNIAYSPFDTLKSKGYCEDLSSYPDLAAFVSELYPAYQAAVTDENGRIWAVPLSVYSYDGFFVSKKVMEDMKLTVDELPTNYVELCEFATRWNDEFVDEFSNYALLEYTEDYKKTIFQMMVDGWIDYCSAKNQPLKFDDAVFREMISALEAMEVRELNASVKSSNPEESDYKQALIWRNVSVVGSWADFSKEDSDRIFIPMTLTKDTDYIEGAYMEVGFINPRSEHKELAAEYLTCKLAEMIDEDKMALLSTRTEPVENENYERILKQAQEVMAEYEQQLAEAEVEEKKEWEAVVADYKDYMARLPERRWRISEGAITTYRDTILPGVYVRKPSFLDSGEEGATKELNTLINRYRDGQIKIDQFIREADGKLRMMQMENN